MTIKELMQKSTLKKKVEIDLKKKQKTFMLKNV